MGGNNPQIEYAYGDYIEFATKRVCNLTPLSPPTPRRTQLLRCPAKCRRPALELSPLRLRQFPFVCGGLVRPATLARDLGTRAQLLEDT